MTCNRGISDMHVDQIELKRTSSEESERVLRSAGKVPSSIARICGSAQ